MYKVYFKPSERCGNFEPGFTIQEAARNLGVLLESICMGKGTCLKCKVIILQGQKNLSPPTQVEIERFNSEELLAGYRLACQARIFGDVDILVPSISSFNLQVIRKPLVRECYAVRPALSWYLVDLPIPILYNNKSDLSRLLEVLKERYGLHSLSVDYNVLKSLSDNLRKARWQVEIAIWNNREVVRIYPQGCSHPCGIAMDVGTTTVAGYLVDLMSGKVLAAHSLSNPQIAYGEDVMSRIAYCNANPEGMGTLQRIIIGTLNEIIMESTKSAGVSINDIFEMVVVGNTCMHHLLLGFHPRYIGQAPFIPALQSSYNLKAKELGLVLEPSTNIHILPIIGGFIGADTIGVLLATKPWLSKENQLIIDIGTNGEIILATQGHLLSCSVATGPVFEGAHVRFGMRAAPGAIERLHINSDLEVHWETISQEKPKGICGSGIISAIANLFAKGVIDRTGKFVSSLSNSRLRKGEKGKEFVIAWAKQTSIDHDIVITQEDIENVLMAKAAIYAGAKVLMRKAKVEMIDRVLLAGAFGNYIDPLAAYQIGMLPECDPKSIFTVGNAAGEGAVIALLDKFERKRAEELAKKVEYVELTLEPAFEHEFAMAMMFPHMKDKFKF
jgi:uncharacterized 2Fe-2S/4Fe-4S cluster protein (DUF4445 family)